jgi:HlyD family secretion protein
VYPDARRRSRTLRLTGLVAAAVALPVLTGCTSGPPADIRVAAVALGTVSEVVQAPANVVARATAAISSPASGTVKTVIVKDGAHVRAGQVLLTIDSPQALSALKSAQDADRRAASTGSVRTSQISLAGVNRAHAAATQAFGNARRAADLIPDPTLKAQALAQLATAEAQYEAARSTAVRALEQANAGLGGLERAAQSLAAAQRSQTQASLSAAKATVAALTVRAPIAGTVVLGGVSAGSDTGSGSALLSQLPSSLQSQAQSLLGTSGSGSTASVVGALQAGTPVTSGSGLLTVTDISTLSLAASVDETDILLVKPGVRADVDFDAVPDATYSAVVTSVDLAPTTSSRGGVSYIVRLSLGGGTNSDGTPAPQPRPGMSAVASLDVLTATNVVSVPAAAVFRDGSHDSVWIVRSGVASKRVVVLGAQGAAAVQVLAGVVVGDRIVVKGADKVTEGQRVEDK